uniref:Uncharacterized protein n=1 Tax=Anguilla anguilla TaxID=7936 RepID=A0A0E9T5U2_ANGAN
MSLLNRTCLFLRCTCAVLLPANLLIGYLSRQDRCQEFCMICEVMISCCKNQSF